MRLRDDLVPGDPKDLLPVHLQECLSFGVILAGQSVVVPGCAVSLDHEPLMRPSKIGHDPATVEDHGSVDMRASESVAEQKLEYEILEFGAGGRWTRCHDSPELPDAAPTVAEPAEGLNELREIHQVK
jgi:hypothetical protein